MSGGTSLHRETVGGWNTGPREACTRLPAPAAPRPAPLAPSLQRAPSGGEADGPRDLVPAVGVSDREAHAVLFDLHKGRQGLGDVLGGDVQRGTQALGRHSLHLGGQLGLALPQEGLGGPTCPDRMVQEGEEAEFHRADGAARGRAVDGRAQQMSPRHVFQGVWRG